MFKLVILMEEKEKEYQTFKEALRAFFKEIRELMEIRKKLSLHLLETCFISHEVVFKNQIFDCEMNFSQVKRFSAEIGLLKMNGTINEELSDIPREVVDIGFVSALEEHLAAMKEQTEGILFAQSRISDDNSVIKGYFEYKK
jgi:hypothetical protein